MLTSSSQGQLTWFHDFELVLPVIGPINPALLKTQVIRTTLFRAPSQAINNIANSAWNWRDHVSGWTHREILLYIFVVHAVTTDTDQPKQQTSPTDPERCRCSKHWGQPSHCRDHTPVLGIPSPPSQDYVCLHTADLNTSPEGGKPLTIWSICRKNSKWGQDSIWYSFIQSISTTKGESQCLSNKFMPHWSGPHKVVDNYQVYLKNNFQMGSLNQIKRHSTWALPKTSQKT